MFGRFLVLLTVAVVMLAACGGDGADSQTGSEPTTATSTTSGVSTTSRSSSTTTTPSTSPPTTSTSTTSTTSTAVATTTSTAVATTTSTAVTTTLVETPTETTVVDFGDTVFDVEQTVLLRFESRIADVSTAAFRTAALAILTDERGWGRAGFSFRSDNTSELRVVLAEGSEVDRLCDPLDTGGTVSCQNGPVVALNADRWRRAVGHWDGTVDTYRGYLVNHEVGHLIGQRHPLPRCPVSGRPAGVMEQQTGSLRGCVGNPWPRPWEIELAAARPVVFAPLPDWGPDPIPRNVESR